MRNNMIKQDCEQNITEIAQALSHVLVEQYVLMAVKTICDVADIQKITWI